MKKTRQNRLEKVILYIPMLIYFVFIIMLLILRSYPIYWITGNEYYYPVYPTRNCNLIPFSTISFYFNEHRKAYLDVFGNAAIFIPMGIYYQLLNTNKKIWRAFVLLLCTILFIETSQYILATGSFDVDDITLNAIGGAAGIAIYFAIYVLCKRDDMNARNIISMASILLVPLLLFIVVQYEMWYHPIQYGIISLIIILIWDAIIYRLYRYKESYIKKAYWAFAFSFLLMYLFLALPEVSPNF